MPTQNMDKHERMNLVRKFESFLRKEAAEFARLNLLCMLEMRGLTK